MNFLICKRCYETVEEGSVFVVNEKEIKIIKCPKCNIKRGVSLNEFNIKKERYIKGEIICISCRRIENSTGIKTRSDNNLKPFSLKCSNCQESRMVSSPIYQKSQVEILEKYNICFKCVKAIKENPYFEKQQIKNGKCILISGKVEDRCSNFLKSGKNQYEKDCEYYDSCLTLAGKLNWPGFKNIVIEDIKNV